LYDVFSRILLYFRRIRLYKQIYKSSEILRLIGTEKLSLNLTTMDSKAHLQEIVRCSFKLKLDLDVISTFPN
jgi:hypothetical protein